MELMRIIAIIAPISYLLHCIEEFAIPGGFVSWYHHFRPALSKQTPFYYWLVNIIAFMLVTITSWFVLFTQGNNSGLIISTSFLAYNAICTHIIGAIKTHVYSPGMITGIILYLPICLACYIAAYTSNSISNNNLFLYFIIAPLYELWNWHKYKKLTKIKNH